MPPSRTDNTLFAEHLGTLLVALVLEATLCGVSLARPDDATRGDCKRQSDYRRDNQTYIAKCR